MFHREKKSIKIHNRRLRTSNGRRNETTPVIIPRRSLNHVWRQPVAGYRSLKKFGVSIYWHICGLIIKKQKIDKLLDRCGAQQL